MQTIAELPDRVSTEHFAPIPWARKIRNELLAMYQPPMVAKATRSKMVQVLRELEAIGSRHCRLDHDHDRSVRRLSPGRSSRVYPPCRSGRRPDHLYLCRDRRLSEGQPVPAAQAVEVGAVADAPGKTSLGRDEIRRILDLLANQIDTRDGWAQWRARRLQAVTAIIAYTGCRKNECLQCMLPMST